MQTENIWDDAMRERFKMLIRQFGTQEAFAAAASIPKPTLLKILSGESDPRLSQLSRSASVLQLDVADLLKRDPLNPMVQATDFVQASIARAVQEVGGRAGRAPTVIPMISTGLAATVPIRILDVTVSAGSGAVNDDEVKGRSIDFPAIFLRGETDIDHLSLLRVAGDSMEPDLRPGDWVLVDDRRREDAGIHVIRRDDQLTVKRIQRHGKIMRLLSANPAYATDEVDMAAEGDAFDVIGRVIWGGRWF